MVRELQKAGWREIGGILMGQHVSEECFRIVDLTIQHKGGGVVSFVRIVSGFIDSLNRFFNSTGHNYKEFNYLGEWHSHPSFSPVPSAVDVASMDEIISDESIGANFAILLIARLDTAQELESTVTVFSMAHSPQRAELILES